MFRIVLIEPEIPQNTGNIGRLCAASGTELVLVGKLGFSLDDKYLKRSGMDYWQSLRLTVFVTIDEYLSSAPHFAAISTKGSRPYTEIYNNYKHLAYWDIIFGCESSGLPKFMYEKYPDRLFRIPMLLGTRSLNLSSAAAVVAYSVLEKYGFQGLI